MLRLKPLFPRFYKDKQDKTVTLNPNQYYYEHFSADTGDQIVVDINSPAPVALMFVDPHNFQRMQQGDEFEYSGQGVQISAVRFVPMKKDTWTMVILNEGPSTVQLEFSRKKK